MIYYPKDTADIISGQHPDNLHYRVNYNQMCNHTGKISNDRLRSLSPEIKPDRATLDFWSNTQVFRRQSILIEAKTADVAVFEGAINGKLVHGLGGHHVRETAITLHPLYGMPYIPSSSVKGSLRNWFVQTFSSGKIDDSMLPICEGREDKELLLGIYTDLFGTQENRGKLRVSDAFCTGYFELKPDVMTVHFKNYYDGSKPPTDDQDPNPITFYVMENTKFEFVLAIRASLSEKTASGLSSSQLLELANSWLQSMLKEQGIGSKTASGYGRFAELQNVTEEMLKRADEENSKAVETLRLREDKRLKTIEEEQKNQEAEERLASMSPVQQLASQITMLTDSQDDLDRSKDSLYNKAKEFADQGENEAVLALRDYWQRTGNWGKCSKKQKVKVQEIQKYLPD